jgi:hypothetical protein
MATQKKPTSSSKRTAPPKRTGSGELAIVGRAEPGQTRGVFLEDKMIKLSDYLYENKVKTSTVKENLKRFLTEIGELVGEAPKMLGDYKLDEIEIAAELTISGELKLLGVGGTEVEGKGGIKFTIRRKPGAD